MTNMFSEIKCVLWQFYISPIITASVTKWLVHYKFKSMRPIPTMLFLYRLFICFAIVCHHVKQAIIALMFEFRSCIFTARSLLNQEVWAELDLLKNMQLNKELPPLWKLIFMQAWDWTTIKCNLRSNLKLTKHWPSG